MVYEGDPLRPEDGDELMARHLASRLLDLALAGVEADLLPRKRWQAIVQVELPEEFCRQDELREELLKALAGRRPLVDIADDAATVFYLVLSASDADRDETTRFAHSVAHFVGTDEGAVRSAQVSYIDTSDIDHLFTLPELQPERYTDIKHL